MHQLVISVLLVFPLLANVWAGGSREGSVNNSTGCSEHSAWLTAFRPFVSLPDEEYLKRYDEWIEFCHNTPNVTWMSTEELTAAWNDYTSYFPLSDCFSSLPSNSGSLFRLCVDVSQLFAVVTVLVYLYFQQYVRSRRPGHDVGTPQSATHHRRHWPFRIRCDLTSLFALGVLTNGVPIEK